MEKLELEKEKKQLKSTIETVATILEQENQRLKDLYSDFIGTREELWKIADQQKIHISNLEVALDKPYFARIDFKFDDKEEIESFYIGKHGIVSDNEKIIVTDWRAPISSLYYDSNIGKCSFDAPKETFTGEMFLKRQFDIEHKELLEYFDVDLVTSDELLQKYLNANNDARLKSIVATIQQEQNLEIRKKMYENLIVQGVAGSGKTTVALHRIAFLVYNYLKTVKQNQYLVIGPNPIFIKYIESVLPELDVSGVTQCTFEQFAQMYIEEPLFINSSDDKVLLSISGLINNDIDKFKCSIKYMRMLESFLKDYISGLTSNDIKIGDFVVVDRRTVDELFKKAGNNYSLNVTIERTITMLLSYIENNHSTISSNYRAYAYEIFDKAKTNEERKELRSKIVKEKTEIDNFCKNTIRKYFNRAKVDVSKLYKLFISYIEDYDVFNYKYLKELKKITMNNIKNKKFDFEDLAALIYIKRMVFPNDKFKQIRHTVIDEAQDLGEFNFWVMKECLSSSTFSIFGDLSQSIYDYRAIDNWNVVNAVMFNNSGSIIKFVKSYRTTAEIMETADDIAETINQSRSELGVRHGESVDILEANLESEIPDLIISKINEYKDKGYKTIAVISKTDFLSKNINAALAKKGMVLPNVSVDDDLTDDNFKICTISNHLVKGLEFDAVIINNAGEHIYSSEKTLDMKLLYVAITRALHELDILYTGELTNPLHKSLNRGKRK